MLETHYSYQFLKSRGIAFKIIELERPPQNAQEIATMF